MASTKFSGRCIQATVSDGSVHPLAKPATPDAMPTGIVAIPVNQAARRRFERSPRAVRVVRIEPEIPPRIPS